MQVQPSPQVGLKLPEISLGLWHNFGGTVPLKRSREIVRRAFELGITHFDRAATSVGMFALEAASSASAGRLRATAATGVPASANSPAIHVPSHGQHQRRQLFCHERHS
jgi:hypothetical protein